MQVCLIHWTASGYEASDCCAVYTLRLQAWYAGVRCACRTLLAIGLSAKSRTVRARVGLYDARLEPELLHLMAAQYHSPALNIAKPSKVPQNSQNGTRSSHRRLKRSAGVHLGAGLLPLQYAVVDALRLSTNRCRNVWGLQHAVVFPAETLRNNAYQL